MHPRLHNLLLTTTALLALGTVPVIAGPDGPRVVAGAATVTGAGTGSVLINQTTQNAIINWNTFNIGAGQSTTFFQPNASAIALNRVIGGLGPSVINGTLTANGRVFIINGDGVLIGSGAAINTAGFLASTNDIRNSDFMAGRMNFNIPGRPDASIINQGTITATSGGFAALVAPGVRNSGTISATLGTVGLAAGNSFTLDFYGDKLIQLAVGDQIAGKVVDVATGQPLNSLVTNSGKIRANGGRVELTAAAARAVVDSVINTSGVIKANTIGVHNGMIVLGAATGSSKGAGAPKQTVKVSGTVSAAGKGKNDKGGTIVITGEDIQIVNAAISAWGVAGGGKVMIGGDWGGGKPDTSLVSNQSAKLESYAIPTATTVSVDAASTINASAKDSGDGGKVVLWSDTQTTFAGTIIARGGANGGNGGFVETSSHGLLNYAGYVDARAPKGQWGTLLLDPYNVFISTTNTTGTLANGVFTPTGDNSVLKAGDLVTALGSSNVIVTTGSTGSPGAQDGNITVAANVSWSTPGSLTLSAYNNIVFNSGALLQSTGAGNIILRADNAGQGRGGLGNERTVLFAGGTQVQATGSGSVSLYYNPASFPAQDDFSSNVTVSGSGAFTQYMLVNNVPDLVAIGTNLDGTYALGKDIKASIFSGFAPTTTFAGKFDGSGGLGVNYVISDLTLSGSTGPIGLFPTISSSAVVQNVDLRNVNISATGPGVTVGALAGVNLGTVRNVNVVSGSVGGIGQQDITAGGLVGNNQGTIDRSFAAASVTIGDGNGGPGTFFSSATAGGLVGLNSGTITSSGAGGNISADGNTLIGGLVGWNQTGGSISGSYATGEVRIQSDSLHYAGIVGGLAGRSAGSIVSSYATGSVIANGAIKVVTAGGLVGQNKDSGSIATSYASGDVTVANSPGVVTDGSLAGGLAGTTDAASTITNSYALGNVAVSSTTSGYHLYAGGFIGNNLGNITNAYSTGASSSVGGTSAVGGFIGNQTSGTITGAYWDISTSGLSNAVGAGPSGTIAGLTITQARTQACFTGTGCGGTGGFDFTLPGVWFMFDGLTRPFLQAERSDTIRNAHQLQLMGLAPSANYKLNNDIDIGASLAKPSEMWGPNGFVPMAGVSNVLSGSFDGQGFTLSGLAMSSGASPVGLFPIIGTTGSVSNLNLDSVNIVGTGNTLFLAPLAGQNLGTITNVNVLGGSVNGGSFFGITAGGLVGQNNGTIVNSTSAANVTLGDGSFSSGFNNAGGLVGTNIGSITGSSASGTVVVGANSDGGGLVGQNGLTGIVGAIGTIDASFATGNVSSAGVKSAVGGLVGQNAPDSVISSSRATGNVTASASVPDSGGGDCSIASNCLYTNAGGLVGQNSGTITGGPVVGGTTTPLFTAFPGLTPSGPSGSYPSGCTSGYTCASGIIQVGSHGTGGGLVGNNSGTIEYAFATGAVTGAAGLGTPGNVFGASTNLGGLVGSNQGTIHHAFATGDVGTAGTNLLQVGGLVGDSSGTISFAFATGNVRAGDGSSGGGLAGNNSRSDFDCLSCGTGTGQNNDATITHAVALGNVSVGNSSVAGGLVGSSDGTITITAALGAVTGGSNSLLGGLAGAGGFGQGFSLITNSSASGAVSSTGPNSVVGGFIGGNIGNIIGSVSSGPVTATSDSYIGGFVGANAGLIQNSNTLSSATVTGSGGNNVIGGFFGANFGFIDPSSSAGNVTSGLGSIIGSFGGANGTYTNATFAGLLPMAGSSFPVGTLDASNTATGTVNGGSGPFVGSNNPTTLPAAFPSFVTPDCGAIGCIIFGSGELGGAGAIPDVRPQPQPQIIENLTTTTQLVALTAAPVVSSQNDGVRPPQFPPSTPLPPGLLTRIIDIPPLNLPLTAYVADEVVLQIRCDVSAAQLQQAVQAIGLTLSETQNLCNSTGTSAHRFRFAAGQTIQDVIRSLAAVQVVAVAQPNYRYALQQEPAQPAAAASGQQAPDSTQYILQKLRLEDVHRVVMGANITIAVIDSEIDAAHPDLAGVIVQRFNAVGTAEKPHAHGTGMAGAIGAHQKLIGIAPGARLFAVHAFSTSAASAESTTFQILKGIDWATTQGVRIINMSFAGPKDRSLERAIKVAYDKNIVLIAAAGNAGPSSPPLYPGADPNVIAVTATDVDDKLFPGANRGRYVAIAAPGVDIIVPAPEGTYQLTTGTSVAAAEVSGVVALMLERNPNLRPADIRRILTATAKRLGTAQRDDNFGWGLVDPLAAVRAADPRTASTVPR